MGSRRRSKGGAGVHRQEDKPVAVALLDGSVNQEVATKTPTETNPHDGWEPKPDSDVAPSEDSSKVPFFGLGPSTVSGVVAGGLFAGFLWGPLVAVGGMVAGGILGNLIDRMPPGFFRPKRPHS